MNFLNKSSSLKEFETLGGGKALNLHKMIQSGQRVPEFVVVGNDLFNSFIQENNLQELFATISDAKLGAQLVADKLTQMKLSHSMLEALTSELKSEGLWEKDLAIRSSGLDEDSSDHSFAGMFSSFLYQRKIEDIEKSIINCWISAYSERCLEYRLKNKLSINNIKMGVVIQKMINSQVSGVMFTRNPIDMADRQSIIIEAVYGQCEGLVSGELEADSYYFDRTNSLIKEKLGDKESMYVKSDTHAGLMKVDLSDDLRKSSVLDPVKVKEVALMGAHLEKCFKMPLDIEWAFEADKLYLLQMRPITTLPNLSFYKKEINGDYATLWDNSNIVESFAGVTTPLTFSLTKEAYATVYKETCRLLNVPEHLISKYDDAFTNMLGFIRGRVYYNLINWYKLLFIIPGSANNQGFMETMMGVKEELNQEQQELFNFVDDVPKYSLPKRILVLSKLIYKFITIKSLTKDFTNTFTKIYNEYHDTDFSKKSLRELKAAYVRWNNTVTYSWKAPIINDFLVMFFFGILKKLTEKWVNSEKVANLQNDLLCGQGEIESTMPTITLMGLAAKYDQDEKSRELFIGNEIDEILILLKKEEYSHIQLDLDDYLYKYGFRCNNEQKLEEQDLTTRPDFIIDTLRTYIKLKNYSIDEMHARESKIKDAAELEVKANISGMKRRIYFWVLKHARAAVKNRENLRFLRSKSFGITRNIFRSIANHFEDLGVVQVADDTFYLNYREIFDYIDGKTESLCLQEIALIRKEEFKEYISEDDPPDRFLTYGAVGKSLENIQIIKSGNLLKNKLRVSDDPNIIYGISCCPGVVTGKVRVAESIEDARDLNGEILVTKRTDPGWVPLFPSCSGLIVERGSLLSHSAVIARELGIPTIVGMSESIVKRLNTGDTVELNATGGEVRIIHE